MCLVIDANQAGDFCKQEKPHLKCLLGWINSGGRVVSAGELERELFRVNAMRTLALEWSRRGNLIKLNAQEVTARKNQIAPMCRSNDAHVVAVTIVGRADVVVTSDKLLIQDLKDTAIVGSRRKIYKENSASPGRVDRHAKLLRSLDCPN